MNKDIYKSHAEWEKIGFTEDEHRSRESASCVASELFCYYDESHI